MNNKKIDNLFVVYSYYHLISSLLLIHHKYKLKTNVLILSFSKSKELNIQQSKYISSFCFDRNEKSKMVDFCKYFTPTNFFFFQESDIFLRYLSVKFKTNETKIFLGPDGAKIFSNYNKKHEFLSMLNDTLNSYKRLPFLKILTLGFSPFYNYRYGSFSEIDTILVPNCKIDFRLSGKMKLMPLLENYSINWIGELLNIKLKRINYENATVFLNQPLWSELMLKEELRQILYINSIQPNFYIKLHPSTPDYRISQLVDLVGFDKLIMDNVPAEFYLANMKDSNIISGWSTSLMHELGSNNKYFFTYNLFKKINDRIFNQIKLLTFEHIQMLNDEEFKLH